MICAKCGTEYEGSQCPKCDGPVIKVNNSDYLARRKAYEERQARLKEKEKSVGEDEKSIAKQEGAADSNNINSASEEKYTKTGHKKKNADADENDKSGKKTHTPKIKNYDEGVFDITKVDFNELTDKLKNSGKMLADGKDRLAKSLEEKTKTIKQKEESKNDNFKVKNNKNKADSILDSKNSVHNKPGKKRDTSQAVKRSIPYTKAGIAAALVLILIAVVVIVVNVINRKNYNIYMSDGNKIYDVSSLDSKFVCDNADAVFAMDDTTFFTPEWPDEINKNNAVSSVASSKGDYYATDVYDSSNGIYTLYIWSDDMCLKATQNTYEHNIYYISNKGTVIYEETETINDNGKTGARMLSMADVKKDKSQASGYTCEANTIERNLNSAYVYSDKDMMVILNNDGRLYQYDYARKISTEVDMYVDSLSALGESSGMYSSGSEHLNTSEDADSYIYSVSGSNYYVEVKNAKAILLKGVSGANITYAYDKKNDYLYWFNNKKISCARFKDSEISDITVLENTGTNMNIIYLCDIQELVYVNDAAQLVKAEKGKKTFIAENIKDGSLSLVKNTDDSLTYVADARQYYIKNTSASPVAICEVGDMTNTSNTGFYKKRLYYYGSDGQLYTCNLKGEAQNVIGNVERFFVGEYVK